MANSHNSRLQETKYTEAEYIFQTIEMANEETSAANSELDLADYFSWKVVKRRQKPQRRYTVSHGAPPAPPSTPTSLSKEHDPLLSPNILSTSPTSTDTNINGDTHIVDDSERFNKLLYTLDYTPKFKKKLKEQERTSAELADLFKVITITGGSGLEPKTKLAPEHGVSIQSRRIRRRGDTFMIHRNPIEHTHEMFDEDSLSAPEFDGPLSYDEFKESRVRASRRNWRFLNKKYKSRSRTGRKMIAKHFEIMEHMDEIADSFGTAMSIRPALK